MITLENDGLEFRFEDVHDAARCAIEFQRTLRLPDDGRTYPLPAGLGRFALRHMEDFAGKLPYRMIRRGGIVMPMWQAEAMWISFSRGASEYPFAVKIATGKINAITGEPWREGLNRDPQDYLVLPEQPWLDGYCVEKGVIRQFVAAPLGSGITVEEQITGAGEHGGLQIVVYPMKREAYERLGARRWRTQIEPILCTAEPMDMGLAPGGKMRQEIYDDPHGLEVWDQRVSSRCFVTILNAAEWAAVTGERPPTEPITAGRYRESGVPWFDHYAADQKALEGAGALAKLKSIGSAKDFGLTGEAWEDSGLIETSDVIHVGPQPRPARPGVVREVGFDI